MKTPARKRLGLIVLVGGICIGGAIQISGRGFIGYASMVRPLVVCHDVDIHWPVLPVAVAALAGLLCWILPGRGGEGKPV
jgi:hypothetical protein